MLPVLFSVPFLSVNVACPFSRQNVIQETVNVADSETTTPNNCRCTSICGCGFTCAIGRGLGETKDWCITADQCGERLGLSRSWDYCQYLNISQPEYFAKTWEEKTNEIMTHVMLEPSQGQFPNVLGLFRESVITTFDNQWDIMPAGRRKFIHGVGAVCKFTLNITDSPYTGMFKNGKQTGIIRMGSGNDISNGAGVAASAAIKFLRSGVKSGNFVTLHRPGESYNMFEYTLSNHIPEASIVPLANRFTTRKFQQASKCAAKVGLSDIARYDQTGNEEKPVFPFKITLKPTGAVNFREDETPILEFMQQYVDKIQSGTELYSFIAHANPDDIEGRELAKLTVLDGCFPSKYGDEKLFFQHQRVEEDIALRPEWEPAYMSACMR